jgi:hypothetical protein
MMQRRKGDDVLSLGTGGSDSDDEWINEQIALRMIALLQEHGWDFTYGRDPVLILIEYEEIREHLENGEDPDEQFD